MIDLSGDFGERAARHLRDDTVAWLTTVGARGAPLPTPVWFLWDGEAGVRVYSLPTAARVKHVAANARVALHFDGDGHGGDIVVFSATAAAAPDAPPADAVPAYLEKYGEEIPRIGMDAAGFAARYSLPLDLELTKLRGH